MVAEEKKILEEIFENKFHFVGESEFETGESSRIKEITKKFIGLFIDKFGAESFQELKADAKVMNDDGTKKEYEVRILFVTDKGSYHSEKNGWEGYLVFKDALEAIENQVYDNN